MSDTLDAIRKLYYGATRATITRDFDRAIDLLKSMPCEEERERAAVYMDGLAQMRADWGLTPRPRPSSAPRSAAAPARSGRSTPGGRRSR